MAGQKMTAHPKMDAVTGEMLFFGYSTGGYFTDEMTFNVVDASGEITRADTFKAPYSSMVHDFIVTRDYVVFPILPLTGKLERAMEGRSPFAWEPEVPGYLGVMRRDAGVETIQWIEIPPCYVFHPMNAFDQDGKVVVDVAKYDVAPLFPWPTVHRVIRNWPQRKWCAGQLIRPHRQWANLYWMNAPLSSRALTRGLPVTVIATAGLPVSSNAPAATVAHSTRSSMLIWKAASALCGMTDATAMWVSRSSYRATAMPLRATAGCFSRSTARRRTARTW